MKPSIIYLIAVALATTGCKTVDCADGTIERNGTCVPADESVGSAGCGAGTHLEADKCVSDFPPTQCDPSSTTPDPGDAGVTTCIGNGGGGCGGKFACPAAATGKQTICGQLFNFEDGTPFEGAATGAPCTGNETTGPCSLTMKAFDAIGFAMGNTTELPHGPAYLDDCGRYRMPDITMPSGPFVALGLDDTNPANAGPGGTTNATGVATLFVPNTTTPDFEAFIVKASTTAMWQASGGPSIATGYYVELFRAHKIGFEPQAGVTAVKGVATIHPHDFYFTLTQTTHKTVDAALTSSGANGTVLIDNAKVSDGVSYSGTGALPPECKYGLDAGAALPGVVFIQIKRPQDNGSTCGL